MNNASEVLQAGLRALEEDEKEDQARLEALRSAIRAGEESGIAEGDVLEEVRSYIRQIAAEKLMGRDCDRIETGYRRVEQGRHVIVYRLQGDGIVVGRVLHQRMLPRLHTLE
jgi:putative addiction module CopG family antidote